MRHIVHTLLVVMAFGLLAPGGVSCTDNRPGGNGGESFSADNPMPPDTLALVEGRRLYDEEAFDLAREQLLESSQSESTWIRAESYLYLNALEMELGNWDAARPWLERYHTEAIKLFRQAVDAEARISEHEEATSRSIEGLRWLVLGIVSVVLAGIATFEWRKRGVAKGKSTVPVGDTGRWLKEAKEFAATRMRAEIAELESQPAGRHARVLSNLRQEALDSVLDETFAGFTAWLREVCPALTTGDVKLCCLSLAGVSTWGRALCFGSTETNIIKQRKHKIKRKLASDDAGRELFEFIFSQRSA